MMPIEDRRMVGVIGDYLRERNEREVDAQTMESKKVKGLYFAGEILDVDGICGGYNLQWAWSSGAAAGKCAGRESDK